MKNKTIGNSIFRFEQEAGIDSKLGNWRKTNNEKKTLSIKFISCNSDNKYLYFNFEIYHQKLKNLDATIFIEEKRNSYKIPEELQETKLITLQKVKLSNNQKILIKIKLENNETIYQLWETNITYQATIICDGLSSKTNEFSNNCFNKKNTNNKEKCLCKKTTLSENDVKFIVTQLRKLEKTGAVRILRDKTNTKKYKLGEPILDKNGKKQYIERTQFDEIGDSIFTLKLAEKISSKEANFKEFSKYLNKAFKKYDINTCLRKIHFLAQSYHETQRFLKTYEGNPKSNISGGKIFRGRGLLQLTHDYNYRGFYEDYYGKKITDKKLKEFAPKVATSLEIACFASAWYWKKNNLNKYADLDNVINISAIINYPRALSGKEKDIANINALEERKLFTNILKNIFKYEECNK